MDTHDNVYTVDDRTSESPNRNINTIGLPSSNLDHVLVVLSADLIEPSAPMDSPLIRRALALAKETGCELEFLHVWHDSTLTPSLMVTSDELEATREQMLNLEAARVAELVLRLNSQGQTIRHDTRWGSPRTDAILRKIEEVQPDLVMKQSREYNYVTGLFSNTDWELARRSSAHVWFVNGQGREQIDRLVTSVGSSEEAGEIISRTDYEVFHVANVIAEQLGTTNYPVHAYQVPDGLHYADCAPELTGLAYPIAKVESKEDVRRRVARKHGLSIQAFAEFFKVDAEHVRIGEGDPKRVIPHAADVLDADLIVMAARDLSRWQRFTQSVNAEPVLANAPCDVLFVKNSKSITSPAAQELNHHALGSFDQFCDHSYNPRVESNQKPGGPTHCQCASSTDVAV